MRFITADAIYWTTFQGVTQPPAAIGDARVATPLRNGSFQITGPTLGYDTYTGDP
jgi:hypothetical protein